MTLTQTCQHCGESRAYEDAMGDHSAYCWREDCRRSRQAQAERYRAKCASDLKYRANFGDGSHGAEHLDIRDARREKWGRAAIVQYRTSIEVQSAPGCAWSLAEPSRASLNGPPIVEVRANVRS